MESQDTIKRWDALRILLVTAACFALICIGFFLEVLWQASRPTSSPGLSQTMSAAQKTQIVNDLSASSTSSISGAGTESSVGSTTAGVAKPAPVSPQQADTNDSNAAAKLQVLDSLNGSQ